MQLSIDFSEPKQTIEELISLRFPKGFSLDNQLISLIINNLLKDKKIEEFNETITKALQLELAEQLISKLKLPITSIEVKFDIENKIITGIVNHSGSPIKFELK